VKWFPAAADLDEPFPSSQEGVRSERPGAVKGAPVLGAAKRTLDGEDRSERIRKQGKAGESLTKVVPPNWFPC
jgi:hypothetical protein